MQNPIENFVLTSLFEPQDVLDKEILDNTLSMIIGLQVGDFILADKKLHDLYFDHVRGVTDALFKANSHRRKYLLQKEKVINDFKSKCSNAPTNTNQALHSPDLNGEIDAVLTQIKAALDSLAKTFNPLFDLKFRGWNKQKNKENGKEESGRGIIEQLKNNLPERHKLNSISLIKFIEDRIEYISYIVLLRDAPVHHGGLKNVSNITFQHVTQQVTPQYIIHGSTPEEVSVFLNRIINEINGFTHEVLVLSLLLKTGPSLAIIKNPNKEEPFPPYRFAVVQ